MARRKNPITIDEILAWTGASVPASSLEALIPAVSQMVAQWVAAPVEQWTEQQRLGAIMLIARFDRRRMSPSGVETVSEMGPVYVSRRDPEVAQLLGLGEWRKPVVL